MVREAVKVEATGQIANIRTYSISDANTIAKGTLLVWTGDLTASSSTTTSSGAMFCGVALADKEAADGSTFISVDIGGVWDLAASGAIASGQKVMLANGTNYVQTVNVGTAANIASGAVVVGTALETATDAEIIMVDLSKR